ncbi:MAG: CPBP family intramembrane metalloprotease [Bacteroidetes bacterium]|nr:CPBP family intramembrane metalloprotease [Bacteroidota bacterium]
MNHGFSMSEITKNPNIIFNPEKIGINKSLLLALMMGMFVFTLLFLWLALKFVQKKPLSSITTGFEKIRWNRYFFSFGIWAALISALTIVSYLTSPEEIELRFDAGNFVILLVVAIIFIPIQTATEELIFRGYLMQAFSQFKIAIKYYHFSFLKVKFVEYNLFPELNISLAKFSERFLRNGVFPLIITSVLFGLMHASNPEAKAHGLLIMMPYYIFFGAFLGVLTLLDEGAELAMGIHCANNLMSSLLVCSKNSVLQTDAIFYTSSENPGGEFITWIVMASICFFILFKKYKLSNWNLLIR